MLLTPAIIDHRCQRHWRSIYDRCRKINVKSGQNVIAGVKDIGNKLIAGVVDTGEHLIAGVVDTSDQHLFANISANFCQNPKSTL